MNQLPDTNNQGISDQSDNLPEIKTLMVNEMPTLIVQEDRYGGSYSNVNYLLFNDLNWRDENFDAGDGCCEEFWEDYEKALKEDKICELYGVYAPILKLAKYTHLPEESIVLAIEFVAYVKKYVTHKSEVLLISDSKHYSWTDAINDYIEDGKDKPKYVIINVDQDIKEVAKQLSEIIK